MFVVFMEKIKEKKTYEENIENSRKTQERKTHEIKKHDIKKHKSFFKTRTHLLRHRKRLKVAARYQLSYLGVLNSLVSIIITWSTYRYIPLI